LAVEDALVSACCCLGFVSLERLRSGVGPAQVALDWFGRDWTLVHASTVESDEACATSAALAEAFSRRGITLGLKALPGASHDRLFERDWVLVRPDGHLAFRMPWTPSDPAAQLADVFAKLLDV
jgi:hypothetical protein